MRELKIEINELKKSQRIFFFHASKESKKFIKKCMYYDSLKEEKKDYFNSGKDLKKRIIFFKEDRIRLIIIGQLLELKFWKERYEEAYTRLCRKNK